MIKSEYGFCECCGTNTKFSSEQEYLREHYLCGNCGCVPRERAIMHVINNCISDWPNKAIHESSPGARGASIKLRNDCDMYISSHYWADETYREEPHININLEKQKFDDEQFDLVVTQDVFEHIPNPERAAQEIYRTLKPGGFLIQTVPLVNQFRPTQQWACIDGQGEIRWFYEPDYHGNPIGDGRSPVFWHFGYDLASSLDKWAGFNSVIMAKQSRELGIEGPLCEVIISRRPESA